MELDEIDSKILKRLEEDARVSYTDLAKHLELSDVAVKKRIDKLIENKVIKNFSVNINYEALGKKLRAHLLIKVVPSEITRIVEKIKLTENVLKVTKVIGSYDLLVEVICEDVETLKKIADEEIGEIKGINEVRAIILI